MTYSIEMVSDAHKRLTEVTQQLSSIFTFLPQPVMIDGKESVVLNRLVGAPSEFAILRNSVLYRSDSLLFHAKLALHLNHQIDDLIVKDRSLRFPENRAKLIRESFAVAAQQSWLLDDLLFNGMSMFDYVGNIIAMIVEGTHSTKVKWKGLLQRFNKPAEGKWDTFPDTRNELIKLNKALVNEVVRVRSHIIHYNSRFSRVKVSSNFANEGTSVVILPNKAILADLRCTLSDIDQSGIHTHHLIHIVAIKLIDGAADLVNVLNKELNQYNLQYGIDAFITRRHHAILASKRSRQ